MWSLESWFSGWDPKDKKELAGGGVCGGAGGRCNPGRKSSLEEL